MNLSSVECFISSTSIVIIDDAYGFDKLKEKEETEQGNYKVIGVIEENNLNYAEQFQE